MAEKEYIERGALIEAWERERAEATDLFDAFDFALDDVPAADVVEVVRCGQCKHWKINPCNLYGGYCRYCDSAKIDHFCGYGERKVEKT